MQKIIRLASTFHNGVSACTRILKIAEELKELNEKEIKRRLKSLANDPEKLKALFKKLSGIVHPDLHPDSEKEKWTHLQRVLNDTYKEVLSGEHKKNIPWGTEDPDEREEIPRYEYPEYETYFGYNTESNRDKFIIEFIDDEGNILKGNMTFGFEFVMDQITYSLTHKVQGLPKDWTHALITHLAPVKKPTDKHLMLSEEESGKRDIGMYFRESNTFKFPDGTVLPWKDAQLMIGRQFDPSYGEYW
jgi:hypothetical protein